MYTGYKPMPSSGAQKLPGFKYENVSLVSDSADDGQGVDWRKNGAVTAVKYQGQCGNCIHTQILYMHMHDVMSLHIYINKRRTVLRARAGCCWAFSAVAAVEGIHQINTGELVSLSEQQVLDCTGNGYGCGGGNMEKAFEYIVDGGGLTTESAYAYQGAQGTCPFNSASSDSGSGVAATIRGYQEVPRNDEASLAQAVAKQPVSVGIDGSSPQFRYYQSGIFTADGCGTDMNHAVTMVGYGAEEADGSKYWQCRSGSSFSD